MSYDDCPLSTPSSSPDEPLGHPCVPTSTFASQSRWQCRSKAKPASARADAPSSTAETRQRHLPPAATSSTLPLRFARPRRPPARPQVVTAPSPPRLFRRFFLRRASRASRRGTAAARPQTPKSSAVSPLPQLRELSCRCRLRPAFLSVSPVPTDVHPAIEEKTPPRSTPSSEHLAEPS